MATIAEASFKAVHDVLKLDVGSGDGKFTVKVLPPTKDMHDDMMALAGVIDRVLGGEEQAAGLDDILCVVANVLSNNTSLKRVTGDDLESIGFDMIDVVEFASVYFQFVAELVKSKN